MNAFKRSFKCDRTVSSTSLAHLNTNSTKFSLPLQPLSESSNKTIISSSSSKNLLKSKFTNFITTRSYVDKKKYYSYTLPSGLEVLIIQDVNVKVSGAAMTVGSGINREGKDIFGLAHYCEHMLFLGSKKYDNPTHFVDFITQHNGKFNGYTEFENTGFFFKINSDKFKNGLDIFSRFFIDPLFSVEYVKKEVNSVNSEFERNIQLDCKRKEMVLREVADINSLFHRFSTGNTKTLWDYTKDNGIDLRERVLEYYRIHYRPDNMKLVIYGDQSVEEYKKLVSDLFSEMKKREEKYDPEILGKYNNLPWEFNKIGKLVLFKTINNHQELDINFMVDDMFDTLPDNPALYYKVLLNYRGKGSLDDVLRRKGLVAGIKTHLRRTYEGFSIFKITGYITKHGIKNLDNVLTFIMKYVKFAREKALDKKLYDYVKRMFDVSFYFMNKKKKLTKFLKMICNTVWKYDKKFYFTQHRVLGPYKEEFVRKFGERLVLNNAIVMVGNIEFDGELVDKYPKFVNGLVKENMNTDKILNKKDPFYKTQYGEYEFNQNFIQSIITNESKQGDELKLMGLKLISNKKKLPKHISLIKACSNSDKEKKACLKKFRRDSIDLTPNKIKSTPNYELWHKKDRSFLISKSNLFVKFIFDVDVNNSESAANLRLLIYALNHHMRNFFHQESLRQTSFQINANANGFSVKIFAFTDTLQNVAINFFKKLQNLKLTKGEFDLIKDEMKNQIKAQMNLVPALRAYVNFFTLILKDYVHNQQILDELEILELDEFENFFDILFDKMYIKTFIHGTMEGKSSIKLVEKVVKIFEDKLKKKNSNSLDEEKNSDKDLDLDADLDSNSNSDIKKIEILNPSLITYQNQHADLSGYYIFREKLNKSYNINHAVMNFYQIGKEGVENIINANMVKNLCGYIYFTQLRIKEQLGYTARAKIFAEGNVIYYMILVQGSKKTPDFMDLRIENVIELMRKRIEDSNQDKFEKFKKLLTKKIGKKDKSLKILTFRLWNEIITGRKYFNFKSIVSKYTENLTKEGVLNFFDKMVKGELKKLSMQEFSQKSKTLPTTTPEVRGYKSVLIENENFFRAKNNFLINLKN